MGKFGSNKNDHARAFMRKHDIPCPSCGYNLRGLEGTKCPECGSAFDPVQFASVGRDLSLLELAALPIVKGVAGVLNLVLVVAMRFTWPVVRPGSGTAVAYVAMLLAVSIAWATWHGLESYDDEIGGAARTRSLLGWITNLAGFGLSRREGAEIWAPVATVALTVTHLLFCLFVWFG